MALAGATSSSRAQRQRSGDHSRLALRAARRRLREADDVQPGLVACARRDRRVALPPRRTRRAATTAARAAPAVRAAPVVRAAQWYERHQWHERYQRNERHQRLERNDGRLPAVRRFVHVRRDGHGVGDPEDDHHARDEERRVHLLEPSKETSSSPVAAPSRPTVRPRARGRTASRRRPVVLRPIPTPADR